MLFDKNLVQIVMIYRGPDDTVRQRQDGGVNIHSPHLQAGLSVSLIHLLYCIFHLFFPYSLIFFFLLSSSFHHILLSVRHIDSPLRAKQALTGKIE